MPTSSHRSSYEFAVNLRKISLFCRDDVGIVPYTDYRCCGCLMDILHFNQQNRRPLRMQRAALSSYSLGDHSSVRKRWSITATWARVALFLADRVVRPLELTPVMIPLPTAHCIAVVA